MPFSVSQKSLCNKMLFSAVQVSVKHILLETKKKKKKKSNLSQIKVSQHHVRIFVFYVIFMICSILYTIYYVVKHT